MNSDAAIVSAGDAIPFDADPEIIILSKGILGQEFVETLSRQNASTDKEIGGIELVTPTLHFQAASPVLLMMPSLNKLFSLGPCNVSVFKQLP